MKVLVIEDQHDIAANIWDYLERRGHHVDHAADGSAGLMRSLSGEFDVIVLDLGLPKLDGLELCRRLRESGRGVPVLMLTARDTLDDKIKGFGEGADDYMVKPFELRELEARLNALNRRRQAPMTQAMTCGPLAYNADSMIASREGRRVALTRAQGAILQTLMQRSPAVVTHQALCRAVWGDVDRDLAALHNHVYSLRHLVDRPFGTAMIQSVHGMGYRLLPTE